jgi:hypothetical protein
MTTLSHDPEMRRDESVFDVQILARDERHYVHEVTKSDVKEHLTFLKRTDAPPRIATINVSGGGVVLDIAPDLTLIAIELGKPRRIWAIDGGMIVPRTSVWGCLRFPNIRDKHNQFDLDVHAWSNERRSLLYVKWLEPLTPPTHVRLSPTAVAELRAGRFCGVWVEFLTSDGE